MLSVSLYVYLSQKGIMSKLMGDRIQHLCMFTRSNILLRHIDQHSTSSPQQGHHVSCAHCNL